MSKYLCIAFIFSFFAGIQAQDSTTRQTADVVVKNYLLAKILPDSIWNFRLVSGKKVEIVLLNTRDYDLSTNNYRQVFKRTPGIFVSEHDASGLQTSISTRGLSANRSWEFNMRQNGYDIAADPSGYPEAYYTPTLDAVSNIEVYRGSSALQYGSQFGGMINYVLKDKINEKTIAYEGSQTVGSYGMFNSYNALGGKIKNWSYYGFVHYRQADGFRQNSQYKTQSYFGKLAYSLKKGKISAEYSNSYYMSQQAGGIPDALLTNHSDTSFRARNWFELPWKIISMQFQYALTPSTNIHVQTAYTFAQRNSVGYLKAISIQDTLNENIGSFNPRQVDIDTYHTLSSEVRLLQSYKLGGLKHVLSGGLRFCKSNINRFQMGVGTGNTNFDLTVTPDALGNAFPREFTFDTYNYAAFLENQFYLGKKMTLTPGYRIESIQSSMTGRSNALPNGNLPVQHNNRVVALAGLSVKYQLLKKKLFNVGLYGNFSQNYRPAQYSEMIPSATTETVDANLMDVLGLTSEIGTKGSFSKPFGQLTYDINAFYVRYNDKIGTLTVNGNPYKTNIGDVESKGVEFFTELMLFNPFLHRSKYSEQLSFYVSGTLLDARYKRWNNPNIAGNVATSIIGKKVEYVPNTIVRCGFDYKYRWIAFNYQFAYTGSVYSDAANTQAPNANATVGMLNAYALHDVGISLNFIDNYTLKLGVNNLTNAIYATRRSSGYPGPGLLPSQGRSFFGTLSVKI